VRGAGLDFDHPCDDPVQEVAVVRHDQHRAGVLGEVLFEELGRLEIEVVGRLVEQEHVRLADEHLGQRDPHLPAAGEVLAELVAVPGLEPEAGHDLGHVGLDAVAAELVEAVEQLALPLTSSSSRSMSS
jgi:hypothetical protein